MPQLQAAEGTAWENARHRDGWASNTPRKGPFRAYIGHVRAVMGPFGALLGPSLARPLLAPQLSKLGFFEAGVMVTGEHATAAAAAAAAAVVVS